MNYNRMKLHYFTIVLVTLLLVSCQRYLYKDYDSEQVKTLYENSLTATADIKEERISSDLLSIPLDSQLLNWKKISGHNYVLIAMWKKASDTVYYKNESTTGFYNSGNRYTFVTLVPQLRDLCRQHHFGARDGINLRLEELLGLPPGSDKEYFIEAWVKPQDLLRPCRDTEITDRTCGLLEETDPSEAYKTYLNWLTTGNAGYPFTQLGYTYDWNKAKKDHEGMSEFLIDKQSDIVIEDIISTAEYCEVSKVRK